MSLQRLALPRQTRRPLLLISLPHSGATGLGRIFATHPDLHVHFEPLNPAYTPLLEACHALRLNAEYSLRISADIHQVLDGVSFRWLSLSYLPPWRFLTSKCLMIKEVLRSFHPANPALDPVAGEAACDTFYRVEAG